MNQHSLPKGWRREECLRDGIGSKLVQVIYWSPQGKKCTTKKQLMDELGKDWDAPECLDFKTGIYSTEALKKKQEKVFYPNFLSSKNILYDTGSN